MAKHDCDHGWVHVCGGPHAPADKSDTRTLVPVAEGGCVTVRCDQHCSCFAPEGVHDADCARAKKG